MQHYPRSFASLLLACIFNMVACGGSTSPAKGAGGAAISGGSGDGGDHGTGGASGGGGGSNASGGTFGGAQASGGMTNTGGALTTGGNKATGGSAASGGFAVDGSTDTGGSPASGDAGSSGDAGGVGNPNGHCAIPAVAQMEDTSKPAHVVGTGSAVSCTSAAFIAAVAQGGVVTFDCGPNPVTIQMTDTARIFNQVNGVDNQKVVIDGGGKITLDGGGAHRILYQNTCDQSLVWATASCDKQSFPQLTVQNITFANALGAASQVDSNGVNGGGAIYVGGGTFKAYNIAVVNSSETSPAGQLAQDLAGGAIYAFELTAPAYFVNSTFQGNSGTNGGAIGGLFISSVIINSVFTGNSATGHGMNPAQAGTTGGGLGGAIYNDGNDYTLSICGTDFSDNIANELGSGAIFQVIDNLNGDLVIDQSTFHGNSNNGSVQSHVSIYVEAQDKAGNAGVTITNTTFN
jgi:hypothetical protein